MKRLLVELKDAGLLDDRGFLAGAPQTFGALSYILPYYQPSFLKHLTGRNVTCGFGLEMPSAFSPNFVNLYALHVDFGLESHVVVALLKGLQVPLCWNGGALLHELVLNIAVSEFVKTSQNESNLRLL